MSVQDSEELYRKRIAKIRQTRIERGYKQKELADYLGISTQAYESAENGRTKFSVINFFAVLDYLGISVTENQTSNIQKPEIKEEQDLVTFDINALINQSQKINTIDREIKDVTQKLDELLDLFKKKKT